MPQIIEDASLQTVLTTFETSPATCPDLMAELRAAYSEFISLQPGFVGAALHVNDAQHPRGELQPVAQPRRLQDMLKTRRDARAEPEDQRALPRVRAGDVRGLCHP
jgi:hypothetical protein